MKKWFGLFVMVATPLAAHPGAHVHPHGDSLFWVIAILVLAIALLGGALLRRK
ncbi:MAG: peptidase M23 [Oceanibulbus sp.]|jgi:hypothetical protein|uniref:peptidase M23 n=1 Tax=Sulfitobacter dubius TaxID=218673 RepID=UPI000C37FAD4|nr:peptidase M23 [Sulfitobacter sp.]